MSKKIKKTVTRTTASVVPAPAVSEKPVAGSFSRGGITTEFNPDYSYVIKDLKRIGVLAGSFFIIIIVLSFFL